MKNTEEPPKNPYLLPLIIFLPAYIYLGVVLSQFLIYTLFELFIPNFSENQTIIALYDIAVSLMEILVVVVLPSFIAKKSLPLSRDTLGLTGLLTYMDLLLAPAAFVIYYFIASFAVQFMTRFSWFDVDEAQDIGFNYLVSPGLKVLIFFTVCIVAPIVEELIFRGFFYGHLREKLSSITKNKIISRILMTISVVIVSALFAFMHGQWNVAVNVFVLSIVLCLMREITGTIYSGIILHILKNTVAFFLLYVII